MHLAPTALPSGQSFPFPKVISIIRLPRSSAAVVRLTNLCVFAAARHLQTRPDLAVEVPFNHQAGHRGIPPTYIQVCGLDVLRDENLINERVLREEYSIPTRLDFYPGLAHHFWQFFPQLTKQVKEKLEDTINGFQWLLNVDQE